MADIFAKIGDIKGESIDAKHKDEIEVLSYSWGVANSGTAVPGGGGAGAGKATFQDIHFIHNIDKASPTLFKSCATGAHLKDATITHRHPGKGQQEYLVIKLNDITVTSVSHGSTVGQPGPGTENVSLAFAKVHFEYRPQKADGSLDAGVHFKYDLKNNKTF